MVRPRVRWVGSAGLVTAALMVVLSGCSAGSSVSPTTSLNQPRPAQLIVQLKTGTSAGDASSLPKRLINLSGDITGTDWNAASPGIVSVYLGSSETVGEIDRLLPAVKKLPHVAGVTVRFG